MVDYVESQTGSEIEPAVISESLRSTLDAYLEEHNPDITRKRNVMFILKQVDVTDITEHSHRVEFEINYDAKGGWDLAAIREWRYVNGPGSAPHLNRLFHFELAFYESFFTGKQFITEDFWVNELRKIYGNWEYRLLGRIATGVYELVWCAEITDDQRH